LAVLLCRNPDPRERNPAEALRLAQAACKTTKNKSPEALDALATATMANGDLLQAMELEQQALTLAQEEKNSDKILRIQERLNLIRTAQQLLPRRPDAAPPK
jgi:predicted Zn-dependent protease